MKLKRRTQAALSAVDVARLRELAARQVLLEKDRQILELEIREFNGRVAATYGNPGEDITVKPDGSLERRPRGKTAS